MRAARLLESLGHIVEERRSSVDGKKIAHSYMVLYFGEVAAAITALEKFLAGKPYLMMWSLPLGCWDCWGK